MTPEQHRAVQSYLETLANRDLVRVWRSLDVGDAAAATRLLLPQVRDVVTAYAELSAAAAADFYETNRQLAGVSGDFVARPAGTAPTDQIDALTRWSVTPIWSDDPRTGAALLRLAGGAQRLIRKAERDTIYENGAADDQLIGWIRIAQPDACAFCLMLASRGAVYTSRDAATEVVGREVRRFTRPGRRGTGFVADRTGGKRRPGGRDLGESYHDNCRCETRPIYSPDEVPQENRDLQDEWNTVTEGEYDQLAAWRQHVDSTRPNQHQVRD